MEVQMVELIHVLAKKTKDMKRSYGKRIRQLFLEVECLHGIIMYEQDHAKQHMILWILKPIGKNGKGIMSDLLLLKGIGLKTP